MGEQQSVAGVGRAAHEHAGNAVPPGGARHETLNGVLFSHRVLPVSPLREVQRPSAAAVVAHEAVGGLWGEEGQLGGDLAGARWTAEQAT